MPFRTVINLEKPLKHNPLDHWNSRVSTLVNDEETRRIDALDLRQSSRTLPNEARQVNERMTEETNIELSNRIRELNNCRAAMIQLYNRIMREIDLIKQEKIETEHELKDLQNPISVISESLTIRDCRLGSEMTYDDADTEIKNELAIAENNQQLLSDQFQRAWEKVTRLEEIKFKLALEIENKKEAEDIDARQLELNRYSSSITFKSDPQRLPKDSCCYEAWLEHVSNLKKLAENELADTYAIREGLFLGRQRARNILRVQQERVEHLLRRRIFETQRARNELEWQLKKLNEEMEKVACEIKSFDIALRETVYGIKLAETRLENRAQRSGMELCTDNAYEKLCMEVDTLKIMHKQMENKINETKTNLNLMSNNAEKISVDLENKQHSLMTDIRALDLRKSLRGGKFGNPVSETQTDRHIKLTQLKEEIPKC